MLPCLNPRSPNSMLSLYHGILPKVVSALFTTLNWGGGGDKICFVNVQPLCYISWNGLKGFVQDRSIIYELNEWGRSGTFKINIDISHYMQINY